MRRILFLLFLFSFGMVVRAQEVKLDSASYAYGDKIIRSVAENQDSIFPQLGLDKKSMTELIRGLEDVLGLM